MSGALGVTRLGTKEEGPIQVQDGNMAFIPLPFCTPSASPVSAFADTSSGDLPEASAYKRRKLMNHIGDEKDENNQREVSAAFSFNRFLLAA